MIKTIILIKTVICLSYKVYLGKTNVNHLVRYPFESRCIVVEVKKIHVITCADSLHSYFAALLCVL